MGQMNFLLLVSTYGLKISVLVAAAATISYFISFRAEPLEIFKDNGQVDRDNHPKPR